MKLLLVDLDDTLINTASHKKEVFDHIAKKIGVSIQQIEEAYEKQKKSGHVDGWIHRFEDLLSKTFHVPVGFLNPILERTIPTIKINDIIHTHVKNSNAYTVIFSYGDLEYQNKKIDTLNLRKDVDSVIITPEYKLAYLDSLVSKNHVTLNNIQYQDVTIIDNDERLLACIRSRYPWIKAIDPQDLV